MYVWYRSVDKAVPANVEVWQKLYVYFDDVAPKLSDDYPGWWINDNGFDDQNCHVTIKALDPNSGIAPPGIKWTIEGHPPFGGTVFSDTVDIPILPLALGDGIRNLIYSATDRAGNEATKTTEIKIDTRGPVTDGASGWVNGLVPYVLTATDQVPGAGVAATVYRVDQSTPWKVNEATPTAPTRTTSIPLSRVARTPCTRSTSPRSTRRSRFASTQSRGPTTPTAPPAGTSATGSSTSMRRQHP